MADPAIARRSLKAGGCGPPEKRRAARSVKAGSAVTLNTEEVSTPHNRAVATWLQAFQHCLLDALAFDDGSRP